MLKDLKRSICIHSEETVAAKQDIKTRFKFQKVYMKNLQEV